jgi:hypothetical protein
MKVKLMTAENPWGEVDGLSDGATVGDVLNRAGVTLGSREIWVRNSRAALSTPVTEGETISVQDAIKGN